MYKNNTFFKKYFKYKQKYLNLKHKISGAAAAAEPEEHPIVFIPCEISNFTKKLYISPYVHNDFTIKYFESFINLFDSLLIKTRHTSSNYYMQDPYILLKDESDKNYAIEVRPNYDFKDDFKDDFKIFKCNTPQNTNNFGGNFISAPNNIIFTIDNSYLTSTCRINLKSPPIVLECGFQARMKNVEKNDETTGRHIDEIMCFMPYGREKYKVWIYKFGTINVDYNTPKEQDISNKFTKLKERYSEIPYKKTIKTTERIEGSYLRVNVDKEKINPYKNDDDTLKSDAEFLNIAMRKQVVSRYEYYILSKINIQIPTVEDIMAKFEEERLANLDKISDALFGGPYIDHKTNFVHFPINLNCNVTSDSYNKYDGTPESVILLDWKFTNIPIFNRLLVETNTLRECIFSYPITTYVNELLIEEESEIKSYLNNKQFTFSYVDTLEYNNQGSVGGNMHCLIKNQY